MVYSNGIACLGVGVGGGVKACPDGLGYNFVHIQNEQFLVLVGGSERLPGWLVNLLAHFGNVKKQME